MQPATRLVHQGIPDQWTGAVTPPVYFVSTYAQWLGDRPPEQPHEYARSDHPTRAILEEVLAAIEEGGQWAAAFASGMAAIDAVFSLLERGDRCLIYLDVYGGTWRLAQFAYQRYGVEILWCRTTEQLLDLADSARLIWIETPTNPLLTLLDIETIARAKGKDTILVVDNTFATPYLQSPLRWGADLVVHSATKYLGGHSDLLLGAVIGKSPQLEEAIRFWQKTRGAVPGPMECFLTLRGIRTLHLRVERQCANALAVAQALRTHPAVERVLYPGLPDHPQHHLVHKQMNGYGGGMIAVYLRTQDSDRILSMLRQLRIWILGESLGGTESLVSHPATMTHATIPEMVRHPGITPNLIRLSCGIEAAEDLIADLHQALNTL